MKIRQGFVSNSSSSSFVIMGFSVEGTEQNLINIFKNVCNKNDEEIEKIKEEHQGLINALFSHRILKDFSTVSGYDADLDDNEFIMGTMLNICVDDGETMDNMNFEVMPIIDKLKDLQKKIGLTNSIKIYCGTEEC